ncbi:SPFH domain / band 7 family protein [Vibrio phage 1.081.O._10N.286.52.C2]|nr:SPFH domain / band 7 family protein [Vibrio phage 1.081.O._10N.286.52.C2]
MFKNILKFAAVAALAIGLTGCGTPAEIPTGYVGKIQTKDGFSAEVRTPSKFRLDYAWRYPDRLILLDVSDTFYTESFKTLIPQDDLVLSYSVEMTMSVDPAKYDFIFTKVPFQQGSHNQIGRIGQERVYKTYAKPKLNTIIPDILTQFSIDEIASERGKVNTYLQQELNKRLSDTPFVLKIAGLTNVDYPAIITTAKETAAERREQENTVKADRKLDLIKIATREEVAKKERAIELYEAATKSQVADALMTDNYRFIEEQKTLRIMASSTNKVFVPVKMLDGLALQTPVK